MSLARPASIQRSSACRWRGTARSSLEGEPKAGQTVRLRVQHREPLRLPKLQGRWFEPRADLGPWGLTPPLSMIVSLDEANCLDHFIGAADLVCRGPDHVPALGETAAGKGDCSSGDRHPQHRGPPAWDEPSEGSIREEAVDQRLSGVGRSELGDVGEVLNGHRPRLVKPPCARCRRRDRATFIATTFPTTVIRCPA